jgi:hypothetical protein
MTRRWFLTSLGAVAVSWPLWPWRATAQEVPTRSVSHTRVIDCVGMGLTPAQCSDNILAKLGHGPAFRLKADAPGDTVHGALMIRHSLPPEPHLIRIELYLADGPPTRERRSRLAAHPNPPTDSAIRALLNRP